MLYTCGRLTRYMRSSSNLFSLLLAILLNTPSCSFSQKLDDTMMLASYRWKNRVLIVRDNSNDLNLWIEQKRMFDKSHIANNNRDLILILDYKKECRLFPADLLDETKIFIMLLVGKDGGVKKVYDRPTQMMPIHNLIDSMPMRKNELDST